MSVPNAMSALESTLSIDHDEYRRSEDHLSRQDVITDPRTRAYVNQGDDTNQQRRFQKLAFVQQTRDAVHMILEPQTLAWLAICYILFELKLDFAFDLDIITTTSTDSISHRLRR